MWTWHVWKVNRVLADISSSYFPKASQAKRLWRCFCKEHSSSDSSGVCGAYWTCAPLVLRVFWFRNSGSCWTTTQVTLTPGAYWPSCEYGLFQLKGTEAWSSCKAIFPLPCVAGHLSSAGSWGWWWEGRLLGERLEAEGPWWSFRHWHLNLLTILTSGSVAK